MLSGLTCVQVKRFVASSLHHLLHILRSFHVPILKSVCVERLPHFVARLLNILATSGTKVPSLSASSANLIMRPRALGKPSPWICCNHSFSFRERRTWNSSGDRQALQPLVICLHVPQGVSLYTVNFVGLPGLLLLYNNTCGRCFNSADRRRPTMSNSALLSAPSLIVKEVKPIGSSPATGFPAGVI